MIRTGSVSLDRILRGGWKEGALVDIQGVPGSGKTTLAWHAVQSLESDQEALWLSVGTEVPDRPMRAAVALPRSAEEVFSVAQAGMDAGATLIIVDTINGMMRQRELDGDGTFVPHPQREYAQELKQLKVQALVHMTTVIFTSMPRNRAMSPIRGTGLTEKAHQGVYLQTVTEHQDGSRRIRAFVRGSDNYVVFDIKPGTGIDWASDLLNVASELNLVDIRGSWYMLGERVQGFGNAARYLQDHPEEARELYDWVMETEIRC